MGKWSGKALRGPDGVSKGLFFWFVALIGQAHETEEH